MIRLPVIADASEAAATMALMPLWPLLVAAR